MQNSSPKTPSLRLTFAGGASTVTGSNFLLENTVTNRRILIDCGLFQGSSLAFRDNYKPFSYEPASIDVLLVTHAHIDHIGRIPKLVRDGFQGVIYSTEETKRLAELLLADSTHLLSQEAANLGIPALYSEEDVAAALRLWRGVEYHTAFDIGGDLRATLLDSGHVLGSAIIVVEGEGKRVVFTGDLGNSPSVLLPDMEKVHDADYLILESVYGNKVHPSKIERTEKLLSLVRRTIEKKGVLLIPAFSLERTQTILYELNSFIEEGKIEPIPVFVDSPLSTKITDIYKQSIHRFNERVKKRVEAGDDVFSFPKLEFTLWVDESRKIHAHKNPKIIIASAGMSTGGRVVTHQEYYLGDPHATILFIGYQAAGSLGRFIQEGNKKVTIGGNSISVRAHIETLTGYSGHTDGPGLLSFVEATAPTLKKVFVAMGEPAQAFGLAQKIKDNFGIEVVVAEPNQTVEL